MQREFSLCDSEEDWQIDSMMRKESLEFLKELVNTPSPTSRELEGQRVWMRYVRAYAEETFSDAYGNCVAIFNKGGSPRVMLAAHADEIAMTVCYIDEKGFLYVRRMGGVQPRNILAQRVWIHTRHGRVLGVIGTVPPHLLRAEPEKSKKLPEWGEIFIDIGATSREEAAKQVEIGDPVTLVDEFQLLNEQVATARAFDNRVGTFAVAETLRLLRESGKKPEAEVCAVSNVMEEVGLYGARQIAYSLKPDVAVVVDVTHATDYPGVKMTLHGEVKLGKGPTVTRGGSSHIEVVRRLEEVAQQEGIPLQIEAPSTTSGTDTDAIFWTRGGIPTGLVSLPNRYMHSPVEVIHLGDLEQIPRLLAAFVLSLKKEDRFAVRISEE